MTFQQPTDITVTQMAQWIDSAIISECDQNILVEYLYHLVLYNSRKKSLFNDLNTYDDFSLFCVSKLLIRLSNQNVKPVKSIVNYIKTVIDPWYSEYVRYFCIGSPDVSVHNFDVSDFSDYLVDSSSCYDYSSYSVGCFSVSNAIRDHIKKLPRKRRSPERDNIYLSCLLTLQDRIDTAINLCKTNVVTEEPQLLNRIIRSLKTRPPVLFHIDESWSNYIGVIVNELIHAISVELTYETNFKVTPSSCLKNLIAASNNELDN